MLFRSGMRFDDYLKYAGTTREKLMSENKEQAAKNVKVRLVMEAIVKAENIGIEEKEIDARIEKIAEENSQSVEEVKKSLNPEYLNYIVNSIVSEKLMKLIKSGETKEAKPAAKKTEKAKAESETEATEKKAPAKKAPAKKTAEPVQDGEKNVEKKPAPKKSAKSATAKSSDAE